MKSTLLTLIPLLLLSMFATQAQARSKYPRKGATRARLGLGAFAVRTVTRDGNGATDEGSTLGLSLLGGISYALHPRLLIDGDLELLWALTPQLDLIQVEMTPGARLFATPRFYGRMAYAVRLMAPENQLLLMGAGYYISQGSVSVFAELNYVLWSKQVVDPPLVPRLGVELRF